MKVVLSWSSGKDSAWTLYQLQQSTDTEVAALCTTINEDANRVAMHAVRRELVQQQAEAAGLPVDIIPLPHPCSNRAYEEAMNAYLERLVQRGIRAVAFGDLHLEDVRAYREKTMQGSGLQPLFPIWGANTSEIADQMIEAGLRARITCLDPKQLPAAFAGREYDAAFLEELPASVDRCGENGEFHSFAFAGPMFDRTIDVVVGETIERDGFIFTDLLPAQELP